jgi:hypothetical protein
VVKPSKFKMATVTAIQRQTMYALSANSRYSSCFDAAFPASGSLFHSSLTRSPLIRNRASSSRLLTVNSPRRGKDLTRRLALSRNCDQSPRPETRPNSRQTLQTYSAIGTNPPGPFPTVISPQTGDWNILCLLPNDRSFLETSQRSFANAAS